AGLVFAATMSSFVFSDLRVIGQVGTTIGLGLLFDTLIVRTFMAPSVAVLLGPWFWWPLKVRRRPASQMLQAFGSRSLVRSLLVPTNGHAPVTDRLPAMSLPNGEASGRHAGNGHDTLAPTRR
ncbi:MAG: MMPL family transporter, partial [Mycobacterium sp.]